MREKVRGKVARYSDVGLEHHFLIAYILAYFFLLRLVNYSLHTASMVHQTLLDRQVPHLPLCPPWRV